MKNNLGKLILAATLCLGGTVIATTVTAAQTQAREYHLAYGISKHEAETSFLEWAAGRSTSYSCSVHRYSGGIAYHYCSGYAY